MNAVQLHVHDETMHVIGECLGRATDLTEKAYDKSEIMEWCNNFGESGPDELRQAFTNHFSRSRFAPSISQIFDELNRLRFGGVTGAWRDVTTAALEYASLSESRFVVFEHAAMHFAIDVLNGWESLIRVIRKRDGVGYARRDFMAAFRDYRASTPYPAGFGSFNGHNVVLYGDPARALGVYRHGTKRGSAFKEGAGVLQPQLEFLVWDEPPPWPQELSAHHLAPPPGPPGPPVRFAVDWCGEPTSVEASPPPQL